MSRILIDYRYAMMLSPRLDQFKQQRHMLINCRCPICGDSQKSKKKARFFIYQNSKDGHKDYLSTACHNCGYSSPFGKFLEEYDAHLYSEYRMELFKEMGWGKKQVAQEQKRPQVVQAEVVAAQVEKDGIDLPLISELPADHPCRLYVDSRMLPAWAYEYLMYADNFKEAFSEFSVEASLMKLPEDPRLVIPFYDEWGVLQCVQGRALGNSSLRYISLKKTPTSRKIFGLDRLDKTKPILVVEGPIDSMMLPNCIATADADLMSAGIGDIFIPDSQYRNTQICDRIQKMIQAGKRVTLFPKSFVYKDINEAVKAGMTRMQVIKCIAENTFSGLSAQMQFSQLRKDTPYGKTVFRRTN